MPRRIAYLGPAGTFTEDATLRYDPDAERVPFSSIPAVAAAVDSGDAVEGVVPIENSLEGSVTATLDLLIHDSSLFIRDELVLPIHLYLLAAPGLRADRIEVIYSYPQPLGQCRAYLRANFPEVPLVASLSTAAAVQDMLGADRRAAAVANRRAGEIYGAAVLAERIEDNANNTTRFVVLGRSEHEATGNDKTSICFGFDADAPGILHSALGAFAGRGINLVKVESRPTKESLGQYIFLVDVDGHRDDRTVKEALEELEGEVSILKVFGSYPKSREGPS